MATTELEKLANVTIKGSEFPSSSSEVNQDPSEDKACLEKLSALAEGHFAQAFDIDEDRENFYKVFRYFGAAYHSSSKCVGMY